MHLWVESGILYKVFISELSFYAEWGYSSKSTFLAWISLLATQRVYKTTHTADVQLKCWLIGTVLYQLAGLSLLFVPGLCGLI